MLLRSRSGQPFVPSGMSPQNVSVVGPKFNQDGNGAPLERVARSRASPRSDR